MGSRGVGGVRRMGGASSLLMAALVFAGLSPAAASATNPLDQYQVYAWLSGQPAGVAFNPKTNLLFVVSDQSGGTGVALPGRLDVIDPSTMAVLGSLGLEDNAEYLAVNPRTNKLYISLSQQRQVAVIDLDVSPLAVAKSIPLGEVTADHPGAPQGIAIDLLRNVVYVGARYPKTEAEAKYSALVQSITPDEDGFIYVIDGATDDIVKSIPAGNQPGSVGFNLSAAGGKVYAANDGDGTITVATAVDRDGDSFTGGAVITTVKPFVPEVPSCWYEAGPKAAQLAVDMLQDKIYVTDDRYRVSRIDGETDGVDQVLYLGGAVCPMEQFDVPGIPVDGTGMDKASHVGVNISTQLVGSSQQTVSRLYVISQDQMLTVVDSASFSVTGQVRLLRAAQLHAVAANPYIAYAGPDRFFLTDQENGRVFRITGPCATATTPCWIPYTPTGFYWVPTETITGEALLAKGTAAPTSGFAPLAVTLDGSLSAVANPSTATLRWLPGDGTPAFDGATGNNTYFLPGWYHAKLMVADGAASLTGGLSVEALSPSGLHPPFAKLLASTVYARDTATVGFACNCSDSSAPIVAYRWDFADGARADTSTATHTFGPGRYHVKLMVVDANGLTTTDQVVVEVTQGDVEPPDCSASALSPAGVTPVDVALNVSSNLGTATWTLSDRTTASGAQVHRSYPATGAFVESVEVVNAAGLACHDSVTVTSTQTPGVVPVQILSLEYSAISATCSASFASVPKAQFIGEGPYTWALVSGPEGMTIDSATGTLSWTPTENQAGDHPVQIQISNAGGATSAAAKVTVGCTPTPRPPPAPLDEVAAQGCGCNAAGSPLLGGMVFALAMLWRSMARRRHG